MVESVEVAMVGEVLGVTVGVAASLLMVGLCHYLGVVGLSLTSAMDEILLFSVCANCQQPCRLSVPQASFFPRIAEASIHVLTRRTNAQLSASGAMNVGLAL